MNALAHALHASGGHAPHVSHKTTAHATTNADKLQKIHQSASSKSFKLNFKFNSQQTRQKVVNYSLMMLH
jgi:hypothetical protein